MDTYFYLLFFLGAAAAVLTGIAMLIARHWGLVALGFAFLLFFLGAVAVVLMMSGLVVAQNGGVEALWFAYLLLLLGAVAALLVGTAAVVAFRRGLAAFRLDDEAADSLVGVVGWAGWGLLLVWTLLVSWAFLTPVLGTLWWAIAVAVLVEALRWRRATEQQALLWMLTIAAERDMPLIPALEAFAEERGGRRAIRARRMAALLAQGVALPDALDQAPGLLPPQALPLVRVGCQAGALAPALRQAASIRNLHTPVYLSLVGKVAYLWVLAVFGLLMLAFIYWKIVPQFDKIFADFHAEFPRMTQWVFACLRECLMFWYLPLLLLLAVLWYTVSRYFGWIQWDLPGLARLAHRNDTAMILDSLALAAGQNRPLLEGIRSLAESYPKPSVRRRLRQAAGEVQSGGDWCDGLLRHGLLRQADYAILQAAQRVGNLPWALREMADSNRRRLAYRVQALTQMLFPPAVLVFGGIVMFVVVGIFRLMIALVEKLA